MKTAAQKFVLSNDAAGDVARIVAALHATSVFVAFDRRVPRRATDIARKLRDSGVSIAGEIGIQAGERTKTPLMVNRIHAALARSAVERSAVLIAVGGGTLTDTVGFAGATYMRGIRWLPVATTVLGMADAAIGGKTGVDLPQGKNLVGAFWPPIATVGDLQSLSTLPAVERRTGMAEIVKAAVIGDARLLKLCATFDLASGAAAWRPIIARAAAVKLRLVARDPLDRGERANLNLGHTIGHALEAASGYAMPHGAAVAIGLRAAGIIALTQRLWRGDDHARMLRALSNARLALHTPLAATAAAFSALRSDKKRTGALTRFVLPRAIGEVERGIAVPDAEIRRVLRLCSRPPGGDELGR